MPHEPKSRQPGAGGLTCFPPLPLCSSETEHDESVDDDDSEVEEEEEDGGEEKDGS